MRNQLSAPFSEFSSAGTEPAVQGAAVGSEKEGSVGISVDEIFDGAVIVFGQGGAKTCSILNLLQIRNGLAP